MEKTTFKVIGVLKEISTLEYIKKKGSPNMYKKTITLNTSDNQYIYVDVINTKLKVLDYEIVKRDDIIEVEFSFKGSEKNGRKYNNIYCENIRKI